MSDYKIKLFELKTRIWTTSGARFNAARRIQRAHNFSVFSIAVLSAIGIAIPIILSSTNLLSEYAGVYSSLLALFVLVISLAESGSRKEVEAFELQRNAEKLKELCFECDLVELEPGSISTELKGLSRKYNDLISSCHFNHYPIDFADFAAKHRSSEEFRGRGISFFNAYRCIFWYEIQPYFIKSLIITFSLTIVFLLMR
jgi:hypothetical protein